MMLLTANYHGCHKVAEWSCACSRMPHCYLDTVLCECSQLSEAVGERSGLHLRAAACTGAIAYHIRKGVPVLLSASWWTPPDHYGVSSNRDSDILGRASRNWGHREREKLTHMTDTDSCVCHNTYHQPVSFQTQQAWRLVQDPGKHLPSHKYCSW